MALFSLSSMAYECSHQNEKSSPFITGLIECNLLAIGVSLTQRICPSRYGSVRDLGFQSTISALDHHVQVSCVRSLAGRLQCLCVISSYELLGSGCWMLEVAQEDPNTASPLLSGTGRRGGSKLFPNILRSRKKPTAHTCASCVAQRTCPANPHAYGKWLFQPYPVASGSVSDSEI